MRRPRLLSAGLLAIAALSGCASAPNPQQALQGMNVAEFKQIPAAMHAPDSADIKQILSQPVSQEQAVRLALLGDPALHAMLAQATAAQAQYAQAGLPFSPGLGFERMRSADGLEIGRSISLSLFELLQWPARRQAQAQRQYRNQLQLAAQIASRIGEIRQSWVQAVAAEQQSRYAQDVLEFAQAGAELARRMQAAGNFSELQRAREHLFYAEAAQQAQQAQWQAEHSRAQLLRLLGLTPAQAASLKLPERLPDLPKTPRSADEVAQAASGLHLGLLIAKAELQAATSSNSALAGLELEGSLLRNSQEDGGKKKGFELHLRLPLFDAGALARQELSAQARAALLQMEAQQRGAQHQLQQAYAAYRSAWQLAHLQQSEILPLQQRILQQEQLRYNGMLTGVFDLMAQAREQAGAVREALKAQQQFWQQDAHLQQSLLGAADAAQGIATE
ncbi:TolC family protein [Massilia sp. W12]|uniref:TolC family protein n=1 Tax=Massilia sp. W12 TaxID=3126507 RepID=UPI0030D1C91E